MGGNEAMSSARGIFIPFGRNYKRRQETRRRVALGKKFRIEARSPNRIALCFASALLHFQLSQQPCPILKSPAE